jgi:hypothetical protein
MLAIPSPENTFLHLKAKTNEKVKNEINFMIEFDCTSAAVKVV